MIDYETANREVSYNPETGEMLRLRGHKAGTKATIKKPKGLVIYFKGLPYHAHQVAWLLTHKDLPEKLIYHLNGDRTDNRLVNLAETIPLPRGSELTVERVRELFDYNPETGLLTWKLRTSKGVKVGSFAGTVDGGRRYRVRIDRDSHMQHRVIWMHYHGETPPEQIDHLNGNGLDNRILNLRAATAQLNGQNKRRAMCTSTTGLLGVGKQKKRFRAVIRLPDGSKLRSRTFTTPEEAHEQYLIWKRQHHEGCTI